MTEAYIFDAVRTPRGKEKKDGSLHEVKTDHPAHHPDACIG
jgi:acetyl-CoA acetyltransferase